MKKLLSALLAVMMIMSMFAGLSINASAAASGPILHYTFDDDNAADISGNGNDGTVASSVTYTTGHDGTGRSAVFTNTSTSYVQMPNGILKDANEATVSWWMYLNGTTANQWFWSIGNSSSTGYWFAGPSSYLRTGITTGTYSSEFNAQTNYSATSYRRVWHHFAAMISGGYIKLYMDGELVASTATTLTPATLGNTAGNYIGRSLYSADPYLNARIDDFMIYDRGLTDAEVLLLAGKTPPAITDVTCANMASYDLDKNNKTVKLSMNYSQDITSIAPTFELYGDAAISPANGTARDFTQPQTYEVTTANGVETWTVSAVLVDPIKSMTCTNMVSNAAIDTEKKTITAAVKDGTNITKLSPEFTLSTGVVLSPASGTTLDFTQPQKYTLIAGTKKEVWTVTIRQVSINNPVLDGLYADPEIAVFNNRFYIYPTTDGYSGWNNTYMTCWSSDDLINWTNHGKIMELGNAEYGAQIFNNSIWAPSVIEADGLYYLFFSAKQSGKGAQLTYGVSDKPEGPFVIPEGAETLVNIGEYGEQTIDSSVFQDPVSGNYYMYWGQGRLCMQQIEIANGRVTRVGNGYALNKPTEYNEGTYVFYRNVNGEDRYYFTYSCNDTRDVNYKVRYCWANTPMPTSLSQFTYPSNPILLQMPGLDVDDTIRGCGHGSPTMIPGTDKWIFAYHRMNSPEFSGYKREVCINELKFNENGEVIQMTPDHAGITIPEYAVTVCTDKTKAEKGETVTYEILTARDVTDVKLVAAGKDIAITSKNVETVAKMNYMPKKWTVTVNYDKVGTRTAQVWTKTANSDFTAATGAKATVTIGSGIDDSDCTAYLFAFFSDANTANSPAEAIRYALSRDGMKFTPVNNNEAIIKSTVGQKGLRDPYICRGVDGDYYVVATDLKTSGGWSNTAIVTYKSTDLVNWTDETLIKLTGITEGTESCGRVWAPEAIYDSEREEYMIYWTMGFGSDSAARAQGHSMNEIWYCYTKDFKTLTSDPAPLFVPSDLGSAIDADIIEYDGKFYMFFKYGDGGVSFQVNEGVGIKLTVADSLTGPYTYPDNNGKNFSPTIQPGNGVGKSQVEGSGSYKLIGKNEWVLNYDCYQLSPKKYDGMLITDLMDITGYTAISRDDYAIGGSPRHGATIPVTEEEVQAIQAAYGKVLEDLPEVPDEPTAEPVIEITSEDKALRGTDYTLTFTVENDENAAVCAVIDEQTFEAAKQDGVYTATIPAAVFADATAFSVYAKAVAGGKEYTKGLTISVKDPKPAVDPITEGQEYKLATSIQPGKEYVILYKDDNDYSFAINSQAGATAVSDGSIYEDGSLIIPYDVADDITWQALYNQGENPARGYLFQNITTTDWLCHKNNTLSVAADPIGTSYGQTTSSSTSSLGFADYCWTINGNKLASYSSGSSLISYENGGFTLGSLNAEFAVYEKAVPAEYRWELADSMESNSLYLIASTNVAGATKIMNNKSRTISAVNAEIKADEDGTLYIDKEYAYGDNTTFYTYLVRENGGYWLDSWQNEANIGNSTVTRVNSSSLGATSSHGDNNYTFRFDYVNGNLVAYNGLAGTTTTKIGFGTNFVPNGANSVYLFKLVDTSKSEPEFEPSACTDKDVYGVNQPIVVTVKTTTDVEKIAFYNEAGKGVTRQSTSYVDTEEGRIWTVVTSVASKGDRALTIKAAAADQDLEEIASVDFKVVSYTADVEELEPVIYADSVTAPETVKVKEAFTLTVNTNKAVSSIGIYNENGAGVSTEKSYVDNGDVRTWTVTLSVSSKGKGRELIIKAKNNDGEWIEQTASFVINATK